jgi:phenylpropionate dioxygenase-like ring-hydroxylating dioxygenase large terminal subunit
VTEIYLRDVWYVAALGEELGEGLLRRHILDEPVLLFRDNGAIAALRDVCPHRFAPLSLGKRKNGGVECPYHGLVFDGSGKCIFNPHGDGRILPSAKVATYPVAERHGLIWIWMGDGALADPARIPDLGFLDSGDQRTRTHSYQVTNANYQLLTDNILDLSHADFLHPLLDSGGGTRQGAPEVKELSDGTMTVTWTWGPTAPLPFLSYLFEPGTEVHSRIAVRWHAPATMSLCVDCAPTREGLDDRETCMITPSVHAMTPETAYSTHYFFAGLRNFDLDNEECTRMLAEGTRIAFTEQDKPMIEAVQANMRDETDIFAMKPLGLIGDAGGVRVREKLRRLIGAERQAVSANQ